MYRDNKSKILLFDFRILKYHSIPLAIMSLNQI